MKCVKLSINGNNSVNEIIIGVSNYICLQSNPLIF